MPRVTVPTINAELSKRGIRANLYKERGYFMFRGPDATDWLNRTVQVGKVTDLSIDEWIASFQDLKKQNAAILKSAPKKSRSVRKKSAL